MNVEKYAVDSFIFVPNQTKMIQRIQSIYLAISMILLIIVSSGLSIFNFVSEASSVNYVFSVFGWTTMDLEGNVVQHDGYPFYIVTGVIILLIFWCLMSFKKLDFQLKLGRLILLLYFAAIVGSLIFAFVAKDLFSEEVNRELGLGYLLFVLGFPFIFLANVGIKRDKKLIDSLNRLR